MTTMTNMIELNDAELDHVAAGLKMADKDTDRGFTATDDLWKNQGFTATDDLWKNKGFTATDDLWK